MTRLDDKTIIDDRSTLFSIIWEHIKKLYLFRKIPTQKW